MNAERVCHAEHSQCHSTVGPLWDRHGSAGFTTISIYTLSPTGLNDTCNKSMCAEAQMEKECQDWALKQEDHSRVRYDRWMRAESIDDIKYVIRQVRGE